MKFTAKNRIFDTATPSQHGTKRGFAAILPQLAAVGLGIPNSEPEDPSIVYGPYQLYYAQICAEIYDSQLPLVLRFSVSMNEIFGVIRNLP